MEDPALLHDYSIDAVINMFELDQDLNSNIDCLLFFKQIIFNFGFSTNLTLAFLLQENINELLQLNTFKPRNMTISSKLLIRRSFKGYRWESEIAIFARKVTFTVPFKQKNVKNLKYFFLPLIRGPPSGRSTTTRTVSWDHKVFIDKDK